MCQEILICVGMNTRTWDYFNLLKIDLKWEIDRASLDDYSVMFKKYFGQFRVLLPLLNGTVCCISSIQSRTVGSQ